MKRSMSDVGSELGYYRLLEASEKSRWTLSELRWDDIDKSKVSPELVEDIKIAAYGELTTFSATEAFMKLFCDDVDFSWRARLAGFRVVHQPAAQFFHDKRLTLDAQMQVGDAEHFYAAEAAMMLAWKYSRPELAEQLTQ